MDIKERINELKREKNAVVLAHYYADEEVQKAADYVGDSYYLSRKGMESKENTIVFCGVRFMAESAKLLSPHKKVLFPNEDAVCAMAEDVEEMRVKTFLEENSGGAVVSYINCSTGVKALSHTCVTSSSAEKVIEKIPEEKIIFIPDRNLGEYLSEKFPHKEFILWQGCCSVHDQVSLEEVLLMKRAHPLSKVMVHPECSKEVRDIGDFIGSTGGMIKYAQEDGAHEYIVVTDIGILKELRERCPHKIFHEMPIACENMKKTSLQDIYDCLREGKNEIKIPCEISKKASKALKNMHLQSK